MRTFVNEPARAGGKVYAVFADLGLANDVALTTLVAEAAAGAFDAVVRELTRSWFGNAGSRVCVADPLRCPAAPPTIELT